MEIKWQVRMVETPHSVPQSLLLEVFLLGLRQMDTARQSFQDLEQVTREHWTIPILLLFVLSQEHLGLRCFGKALS